ncbi:hypothetical protein, partial [Mangrovicoccus sp. HB161399]|uniref:hypothetical protein n=1 Tax=Mangrovicoccus sp. HB161399 TaxID=2720392 RepID=UPI001C131AA6
VAQPEEIRHVTARFRTLNHAVQPKSMGPEPRAALLQNSAPSGIHVMNPVGYEPAMCKPEPARYRTTNWKSYNDALKRRGSLLV